MAVSAAVRKSCGFRFRGAVLVAACGLICLALRVSSHAGERVTLETATEPAPNTAEEPLTKAFSLEKAAAFLDQASLWWQKEKKCGSCHTNYAYMLARPSLKAVSTPAPEVRAFFEDMIANTWETKGPRWEAEVVTAGVAMAFNDARTSGKLHPLTRKALDRMWTVQREDGGWNWLKCDWPPMESDDHYGVTFAALGVGIAPDDYAKTPAAQAGLAKIRKYLKDTPASTLHHRAMIAWASLYVDELMSADGRRAVLAELLALQRPDGGWATATLGDWKRADGKEQDRETSDGYGTGFVIYLARQMGVPANDARLARGIEWLKTHQRESGRWFTRSLNKDNKHYLTHIGTAFAVMALEACGEVPSAVAAGSEQ